MATNLIPLKSDGGFDTGGNITADNFTGNVSTTAITFDDATVQTTAYPGTIFEVSDTAPNTEVEGHVWFNSVEGRSYVLYNGQWIDSSPQTVQPPGNELVNGDNVVELDEDGLVNLPAGGQIGNAQKIHQGSNTTPSVDLYAGTQEAWVQLNYNEDQFVWADSNYVGVDVGYNTTGNVQDGKTWRFDKAGNIVFPDDTEQNTAYPGPATLLDGGNATANYISNVAPAGALNPFDQELNTSDNVVFLNVTSNSFTGNLIGNVDLANVYGAGNIASINLTGSSANVLYGNGVFAPASGTIANTTTDNFYIDGEDKGLIVDAAELKRFGFMKYSGIEGTLVHTVGPTQQVPLRFGRVDTDDVTTASSGNLTTEIFIGTNGKVGVNTETPSEMLDVNGNIKTSGSLKFSDSTLQNTAWTGTISLLTNSAATFTVLSDNTLLSGTTSSPQNFKVNDTYTPDIDLRNTSGTGMFTQGANLTIRTAGTYNWNFDNTGNLVLPGNTFTVNYANGTQVSIGGGGNSSSIANGNSNVSVATANGNVTVASAGNTIMTVTGTGANVTGYTNITGNVTAGNVVFAANAGQVAFNTGAYISGNANSISRDGSIILQPYTGNGSNFAGVVVGGAGRLISPNGGVFQIFNAADVTFQVATKVTVGTAATTPAAAAVIVTGGIGASGTSTTGVGSLLTGPTFTPLANTVAGFNSNVNSYTQVTLQNKSNGADATTDYVLTADNGSDTVNYGDFGIINSGYDANTPTNSLGNIVYAADTYLYAQGNTGNSSQSGGNLAIGTTVPGKNVKIFAGGVNSSSIIANISNTGIAVNGNVTATNFSGNISITGNVTGTSPNVTLVAGSYSTVVDNTGNITAPSTGYLMGGTLRSTNSSGNEGGELQLALAPNATISGNTISIDNYINRIRIFEGGGNARGVYIDLSKAPDGVGGELMWKASGVVNAGVDVTLGNLKARIPTSGNRSLQVSTVTGTYSVFGSGVYYAGGAGGATINGSTPLSITTTPAYLAAGLNFSAAGYTDTWNLYDPGNSIGWRITLVIGVSYANNMISIERLA